MIFVLEIKIDMDLSIGLLISFSFDCLSTINFEIADIPSLLFLRFC